MLPLIVQSPGACPTLYALPADAVLEVALEHPQFAWFADLGLRWYAVPVISDMYLEIGGVCYPAAPFNGWYMCTEIGSRDFGDADRYNQLPVIASYLGLSMASEQTLWKDKALTELNLAVLHSFNQAGVTITDHHTESDRFLRHLEREERAWQGVPGRLDLDRPACGVVGDAGLPSLLPELRSDAELLPAPGARRAGAGLPAPLSPRRVGRVPQGQSLARDDPEGWIACLRGRGPERRWAG